MGRELGRISGPLLADNLKRNGSNLAFDNQVLYLDVVNSRVGFNTNAPVTNLYTPTAIDTVNLIVDTSSNIANFTIGTNIIQNAVSSITISPNQASNPTIVVPALATANLNITGNTISDTVTNDSIYLTANGTGAINLNNNTTVTGNLHATGTVTWDGNITLGSTSSDTVSFGAEINSNILPSVTNTDNLGSSGSGGSVLITTGLQINLATAPSLATVGTTWTDTSGNNNNGTLAGSNSYLSYTSNDGGGISISGSESGTYISTGYNIASNTFTISMVASLNPTTFWSTMWGNDSWSAGKGYLAYFLSTTSLNVGSPSGTANFTVSNITNINVWDFVISGTSVTVYQNGTSLGTKTFTGPSGGYATTGLYFASRHANNGVGPTDNCVGTYYAMRVYNSALNSTQILNNYNAIGATYGLAVSGAAANWATTYTNTVMASAINTSGLTTATFTGSGTNALNGNVTIGTSSSNTLNVIAEINSNLLLQTSNTYDLGSNSYYWNTLYISTITDGAIQASSNGITTTTTNTNLQLKANGTGNVVFSSLNLTNNATLGSLNVTGSTTLSSNVTSGVITQTGSYNITGSATLGAITSSGSIIAANPLTLPTITINNSTITGTASGSNLKLTANTGYNVEITAPAKFDNNVIISGTLGVTGTTTFSNTSAGAITQTGDFTQTGTSSANITGTVTATSGIALNGSNSSFTIGNITSSNQTITNSNTNSDIEFLANGSGNVWLGNLIEINSNNIFNTSGNILLTPNGTGNVKINSTNALVLPIGDNSTRVLSEIGEIRYNDISNQIEADGVANAALYITTANVIASGDGYAVGDILTVTSASGTATFTVTSIHATNLYVNPNTGNVTGISITSNGPFTGIIPIGVQTTTANVGSTGSGCTLQLQYTNEYVNFFNLFSSDRQTYITGELTPGTADNIMRFAVGNNVTTTINSTTLFNNTLYSGNISISGNQISNLISTNDIDITPSGTGKINVNGTDFDVVSGNYITNSSNGAFVLASTGNGYYKFAGTNGLVIPVGTNSNYPVSPETGATRYNTTSGSGEVFNGTNWQPIGGTSAVLSQSEVDDVMWAWDLILG